MHILAIQRKPDSYGSGSFGASRGKTRKHVGIDYNCSPGSLIFAPLPGKVTKLGYPYADDLSFRYVEVTTDEGIRSRVFYIYPLVELGDIVSTDSVIGRSQDLTKRYPADGSHKEAISNHCHWECKDKQGNYHNPSILL